MTGKIELTGIRCHGYHGCLPEEERIGQEYVVDVVITTDLALPAGTDKLRDTIDYVVVNRLVVEEVRQRSKLIEHVARRILDRLKEEYSIIDRVEVVVRKPSPPINGNVDEVAIRLID